MEVQSSGTANFAALFQRSAVNTSSSLGAKAGGIVGYASGSSIIEDCFVFEYDYGEDFYMTTIIASTPNKNYTETNEWYYACAGGIVGFWYGQSSTSSIRNNSVYAYMSANKSDYICGYRLGTIGTMYDNDWEANLDDEDPAPLPTLPPALTIETNTLANGTVGTSYSQALSSNFSGVTWAIASGTFPDGLVLNTSTGGIAGVPTSAGTYNFTVRVSKSGETATKAFTMTITEQTHTITTASLPKGTVGTSYSQRLTASTSGVTWSVSYGMLPAGLSLNASTGMISGSPTTADIYTFTIKATK